MLRVPTPQFFPPGGTFTELPPEVALAVNASGATIRYTLDGAIPTTFSAAYAVPIPTDMDTTITAVAFRSGWAPSRTGHARVSPIRISSVRPSRRHRSAYPAVFREMCSQSARA